MKLYKITCACILATFSSTLDAQTKTNVVSKTGSTDNVVVERFADINVLRYQVPVWDKLTLKEKELVYYLTQACTSGRDIMWDQNYRHNLKIRKALENIYTHYNGDKKSTDWKNFEIYLKRVWFSNGIHHHYSNDKIASFKSELIKSNNWSRIIK